MATNTVFHNTSAIGNEGSAAETRDAAFDEQAMSLKDNVKLYWPGVLWALNVSFSLIMEGFDIVLLQSLYAMPQFNQKYGVLADDGTYTIPASWKTALSNGALCGQIIGLFFGGFFVDRYGYKKTIAGAQLLMKATIFALFFAPNVQILLLGEILCGVPWGMFQCMATAYSSDVVSLKLRPILCTWGNACWVIGQLIASSVLRGMLDRADQWAYRIPFALQWAFTLPLWIYIIYGPESPWWLVRKNRIPEAKQVILSLTSRTNTTFNPDAYVAMMTETNEREALISAGTSYLDCFKGTNLRRTECASLVWLIQATCGSTFMGYSTYFYQQAGLPTKMAFNFTMGQYAIGIVGTLGSWFLIGYIGRRTIYLVGCCILFYLLLQTGFISLLPETNKPSRWAIGSSLLVYTFIYDLTVGPICYALISELSSTRLKSKTIVISRMTYIVGSIISNFITNYQLTPLPTGWDWGARSAFFWAASCALCVFWIYFRLPEPKGRTCGEMDVLFECKISARNFKETKIEDLVLTANMSTGVASSMATEEAGKRTAGNPIRNRDQV
ncbi:hypothetical protein HYALB_00000938 [Hymenoscyphus albidus]|uniref:Major facilitator superfamily (MFS) profile domain-containing protein n=1 Tax=Hymenoscyphus albidus TaxID=595503 RepID=A0A9N9LE41_9HELO|nr:hypothetical protein HYALB_00000938 [Hymenoscyphus albidus]